MRKEQKRLAKAARKRRAIELQASCQNGVEDSGPGGRGGRESTIRRELTGSEPLSGEPNDSRPIYDPGEEGVDGSETDSGDGNDCADEAVS